MVRPVVGVIANTHIAERRFPGQIAGERNLRAVAEVAGALPLMFASVPDITDIDTLLATVDGVLLTGARANVHPTRLNAAPHAGQGSSRSAPYSGPQPVVTSPSPGYPSAGGVSLGEAVQAAHEEGQEFGASVARDAPALWLEAVLARKPRMPSDLDARLLQGSALPIDFLLHDEVRHALRRGFWDALERTRR